MQGASLQRPLGYKFVVVVVALVAVVAAAAAVNSGSGRDIALVGVFVCVVVDSVARACACACTPAIIAATFVCTTQADTRSSDHITLQLGCVYDK